MEKFMEVKSINPKLKRSERVREHKISSSTLQRYRKELNMLSTYRTPNTHTRKQKSSDNDTKVTSNDLKMTSNDLKVTLYIGLKNHLKTKITTNKIKFFK